MPNPVRILVVGCGHMGTSHAKAYHALPGFEIVGVVSRGEASRRAGRKLVLAADESFRNGKTVELPS
jgi:predicted dehydrogenase